MQKLSQLIVLVTFIFFGTGYGHTETVTPIEEGDIVKQAESLLNTWKGERSITKAAKSLIDIALDKNLDDYRAYKQLARYYLMYGYVDTNDFMEANNKYKLGVYPSRGEQANGINASIRVLEIALAINPDYSDAYVLLGHAYTRKRDYNSAYNVLKKAEKMGSTDHWLYLNMASLFIEINKEDEALSYLEKVYSMPHKVEKVDRSIYQLITQLYTKKKDFDQVIKYYKEAIAKYPNYGYEAAKYAKFLTKQLGRYDEAISIARSALGTCNSDCAKHALSISLFHKWADLIAKGKPREEYQSYYDEAFMLYPKIQYTFFDFGDGEGGANLVKAFIGQHIIPVNLLNDSKNTALIEAAISGNYEVAKAMIELGVDINVVGYKNWTALSSAADEGYKDIVTLLIDSKVEAGLEEALRQASLKAHVEIVRILKGYMKKEA